MTGTATTPEVSSKEAAIISAYSCHRNSRSCHYFKWSGQAVDSSYYSTYSMTAPGDFKSATTALKCPMTIPEDFSLSAA